MSRKRSLQQVLAGQWIAYTLLLLAGFSAMAVTLLYVLEDSFINDRLRGVAADLARMPEASLPPGFLRYPIEQAPTELNASLKAYTAGRIVEQRLSDGRYVHALRGDDPETGEYLLVYDVSDNLRVNQALSRGWPGLLSIAGGLVLLAWWLARSFVHRIVRRAHGLIEQIDGGAEPAPLYALAARERILEFSELARLAAEAWQSRLQLLQQERETLAFLGHELRTPLQSARTSLALLRNDRSNQAAWARLQRATDRLARASHSVLWLASDGAPTEPSACELRPVLNSLFEEFAPLAAQRGQQLELQIEPDLRWPLPEEVVETVLANGLLNAIQHGGPGTIKAIAHTNGLELHNRPGDEGDTSGFGLGLRLSQRLLQRFGWSLRHTIEHDRVALRLSAGHSA